MKACVTAAPFALLVSLVSACPEAAPPSVPPPTSAKPDDSAPILSESTFTKSVAEAPPVTVPVDAAAPLSVGAPPSVKIVEAPTRIEDALCRTVLFAVAKGKMTAMDETLGPGDVLVVKHAMETPVKGTGLAVYAVTEDQTPCSVRSRPAPEKVVVRGKDAPPLRFAGGAMTAHLDVGTKLSPDLYLGRLEGTAPVAEHTHPQSYEVVAALEAAGTFTLDGKEARLGPKQVVVVPPGAKHAWRPDPSSKLVAVQLYAPPGPEQRFIALAKDTASGARGGGADGGAPSPR